MKSSQQRMIAPRAAAWAACALLGAALAVAQPGAPSAAVRGDGQIEMDVVHVLDSSSALRQEWITAETVNGEVMLTGVVSGPASKELAESLVARVAGVTAVNNQLQIGDPKAAAAAAAAAPPPPVQPVAAPAPEAGSVAAPPSPAAPVAPPPPPAASAAPLKPVTVPVGSLLQLRTSESLSSRQAQIGQAVQFQLLQDVLAEGVVAIPRGAIVRGEVTDVKKAGGLAGSSELGLRITSLDLGANTYPLLSDIFKVQGPGKGGKSFGTTLATGMIGTVIGCVAGGGVGCAVGAGVGVGAGVVASGASSGDPAWLPAESRAEFHLAAPLTLEPVSEAEAARMAQRLTPAPGPVLYERIYAPAPAYVAPPVYITPPPPPPPYYYRPYYSRPYRYR